MLTEIFLEKLEENIKEDDPNYFNHRDKRSDNSSDTSNNIS